MAGRRRPKTAGATGSTYTLVDADTGKAISVRVSFTDDADNEETLTSVATDAVTAAPEPPAKPTGLSSTVSHDTVTLNWEDPNDNSITGYVILRRDKEIHEEGTFVTVAPDTGSAANTYTDDTVEPSKQYVYRIKAINAHGLSEISSWVRAYTPATSEPPAKPTGLSATATHDQAVLTWDNPGDDGITGYVILRRNQETDAEGEFTELVSDTGQRRHHVLRRERGGRDSLHLPYQGHQRTRGERAFTLVPHRHAGSTRPGRAHRPVRHGNPRPGDAHLGRPQ